MENLSDLSSAFHCVINKILLEISECWVLDVLLLTGCLNFFQTGTCLIDVDIGANFIDLIVQQIEYLAYAVEFTVIISSKNTEDLNQFLEPKKNKLTKQCTGLQVSCRWNITKNTHESVTFLGLHLD